MYSLLIDTYIKDPSEKEYLFNAIETSMYMYTSHLLLSCQKMSQNSNKYHNIIMTKSIHNSVFPRIEIKRLTATPTNHMYCYFVITGVFIWLIILLSAAVREASSISHT